MIALLLMGCARNPPDPAVEPLPSAGHVAAEASALQRVPDAERGGDPVSPSAAPLPPFLGVDRSTARYTGAAACSGCHVQEYAAWSSSPHARTQDVLEGTNRQHDPSCLRCHTTGFGHPGGFGSGGDRAALVHVGCESCHGPGSDHLVTPAQGYGDLPSGFPACVACHTHDNSPEFAWDSYWALVQH